MWSARSDPSYPPGRQSQSRLSDRYSCSARLRSPRPPSRTSGNQSRVSPPGKTGALKPDRSSGARTTLRPRASREDAPPAPGPDQSSTPVCSWRSIQGNAPRSPLLVFPGHPCRWSLAPQAQQPVQRIAGSVPPAHRLRWQRCPPFAYRLGFDKRAPLPHLRQRNPNGAPGCPGAANAGSVQVRMSSAATTKMKIDLKPRLWLDIVLPVPFMMICILAPYNCDVFTYLGHYSKTDACLHELKMRRTNSYIPFSPTIQARTLPGVTGSVNKRLNHATGSPRAAESASSRSPPIE